MSGEEKIYEDAEEIKKTLVKCLNDLCAGDTNSWLVSCVFAETLGEIIAYNDLPIVPIMQIVRMTHQNLNNNFETIH